MDNFLHHQIQHTQHEYVHQEHTQHNESNLTNNNLDNNFMSYIQNINPFTDIINEIKNVIINPNKSSYFHNDFSGDG